MASVEMAHKLLIVANPFPPSGPMGWSMRVRKWCHYMRDYGWDPTVLTGPFHYGATCAPLNGVKVVGRVRPSLSQPVAAPKAWKIYARKFLVPDPYVVRWLPLAFMQSRNLSREDSFDAILSTGPVHTCHLVAL